MDQEFETILKELVRRAETNKLLDYDPYPFQIEYHHALGKNTTKPARQTCLLCANKIGKTWSGIHEDAFHLTGLYPDWWKGYRFERPIKAMVATVTVDLMRDTIQTDMFGDPFSKDSLGTGIIPKDCLDEEPIRKTGYVGAIDSCAIKHVSGGYSLLKLLAYEQGPKKFYARGYDLVHFDEEPPQVIYSQGLRSLIATKGILKLTFTSEEGVTQVVDGFLNELKDGQALVTATWDDAPHIRDDPEHRQQLLDAIPPHERDMRTKGIPMMGSGLIFPIKDETITVDPFEIPPHWPRICGMDLGGQEHPFAAVWLAWDRDNDIKYIYREYKNRGVLGVHCEALREGGCDWIPVVWPHDAGKADRQSGRPMAEIMREKHKVNMLPNVFSNPPSAGEPEGKGGQGVEVGIFEMYNAMESGSLKVFSTCSEFFREKNIYHRKEGKIVALRDDIMSAARYAFQSTRFADIRMAKVRRRKVVPFKGVSNW